MSRFLEYFPYGRDFEPVSIRSGGRRVSRVPSWADMLRGQRGDAVLGGPHGKAA